MDPEELGSANCLKWLIVDSEGIYLGCVFYEGNHKFFGFLDI